MSTDDRDLRDRFEQMRSEDAAGAPAFAHTLARARAASRRPAGSHWRWAGAAAGVAVVLLWWLAPSPSPAPEPSATAPPSLSLDHWAMPTDVLLEGPGTELLRDLPEIAIQSEPATSLRRRPRRTHA